MSPILKISGAVGAIILLVIVLTAVSLKLPEGPSSEISFSSGAVSTSSNISEVAIVISNPSSTPIMYYVGAPEFKLNGVWEGFSFSMGPMGPALQVLNPGHSVTNIVSSPQKNDEARVPVLWAFMATPKTTKWQALREDVAVFLRMHNSRGRGMLQTNFVTGVKL
jgi:hypothetical protein